MTDHDTYQSPLSWRYGSDQMRRLWSETTKRRSMRRVWLALAETQAEAGLITEAQLDDLRRTADAIDIPRATAIEEHTRHDVMAEIRTWAEQAPAGGTVLHLGATSADVTDNVDALRLRDGLALLRSTLVDVLTGLAGRVEEAADLVTLGWTHLQPAAPTTVGYRLAASLQDFLMDLEQLDAAAAAIRGKGFKGAVGTAASYQALLAESDMDAPEMEARAMARLGLKAAEVTTQVYPRKVDWLVLNALAGIAASAATLAFNVRLMQSPPYGEWSEGFAPGQVGSTAMPWKRNPIDAENITSLARLVAAMPVVAWQNEAANLLERTLDDSANRRLILPEAFLLCDEILQRTARLASRLLVDAEAVAANVSRYGPFAALESVLLAAAAAGGSRQELHELLREHAMSAWAEVERGAANPLPERLAADARITRWLSAVEVTALLSRPLQQVGTAPQRARALAARAREATLRPAPTVLAPD